MREGFIEGTHLEWYLCLQLPCKQLFLLTDGFASEIESLPTPQPHSNFDQLMLLSTLTLDITEMKTAIITFYFVLENVTQ